VVRSGRMARADYRSSGAVDDSLITADVEVLDPALLLGLTGPNGDYLRILEHEFGVAMGLRGNTIRVAGAEAPIVEDAARVLYELIDVLGGRALSGNEIARAARTARAHPDLRLRELFEDVALSTGRRIIAPKGVHQQRYLKAIRTHDVVFGIGPAGTGKTYLAVAMAVAALKEKRVKRIILTRPAVEAGERLGFLPGDLAEKINPYLRPLYDALNDMLDPERVALFQERGTIEVAPLAFMRGRTLNDAFVILDEAQNTTMEQMKMFLTRLGFGSKAVITGDVTQVDLPRGHRSGLRDAEELLRGVEGIAIQRFNQGDVVRHPLVQRIVAAYDVREAAREAAEEEERERERRGGDGSR
jgi:phosphate starvation-inducible protein PhoH and related proteins